MKNIYHATIPAAMVGLILIGRNDLAILAFALQGAAYIVAGAIKDRS